MYDGTVAVPTSVGVLSEEAVVPPYITMTVPRVARTTASSRLASHFRLKSLTLMRYAKKALVFQIAVTSLIDAKDTAANHSNAGHVIPKVMARTKRKNLACGKLSVDDFCAGARWFVIAIARPFVKATAE